MLEDGTSSTLFVFPTSLLICMYVYNVFINMVVFVFSMF